MDKYQKWLIERKKGASQQFIICLNDEVFDRGVFDCETQQIKISQHENYTYTKYKLIIMPDKICSLDWIFVWRNNSWEKADYGANIVKFDKSAVQITAFSVDIDFCARIEKIKLTFKDGIVDDCVFQLCYIEADKDAYLAKIEEQKKQERNQLRLKNAMVKHSVGNALVNIYFQPCCEEYDHTRIALYFAGQLIAKYNVEGEMYFKSITGLAYGTYEYILTQYNKKDEVLLEIPKTEFKIK